ncbi:MAG TPA: hypothetical protein VIO11_02895 [Candidatus Methanoperedens sp.]
MTEFFGKVRAKFGKNHLNTENDLAFAEKKKLGGLGWVVVSFNCKGQYLA